MIYRMSTKRFSGVSGESQEIHHFDEAEAIRYVLQGGHIADPLLLSRAAIDDEDGLETGLEYALRRGWWRYAELLRLYFDSGAHR